MASALGIGCRGNNGLVMDQVCKFGGESRCSLSARPLPVVFGDRSCSRGRKGIKITGATMTTATATARRGLEPFGTCSDREGGKYALGESERVDEWMRDSVVEIVKNLREAPLLVQVYPSTSETKTTTLMTEKKAVVEDWPVVKEKWEAGETPLPDGLILVEELVGDGEEEGRERTTKAWGVVVQGRWVGCGPVCYLLKTSRVGSGPGAAMGECCTHFCLLKVKSLRETAESQLKNCWLLQSQ